MWYNGFCENSHFVFKKTLWAILATFDWVTAMALQFAGWFSLIFDCHNHFAKNILIVPFGCEEAEAMRG